MMTRAFGVRFLSIGAIALLVGCGGSRSVPPGAGHQFGGVPDMRGDRVMVLPTQFLRGGHPSVNQELIFALESRGGAVRWVGPEALRDVVARMPGARIDLDGLPVHAFLLGEVRRIGDPLFGEIYRLGAFLDARYALIPVEIRERPGAGEEEEGVTVELAAALIETRTGRVFWYGIIEGVRSPESSLPGTVAAVEALARRLVP